MTEPTTDDPPSRWFGHPVTEATTDHAPGRWFGRSSNWFGCSSRRFGHPVTEPTTDDSVGRESVAQGCATPAAQSISGGDANVEVIGI